MAKSKANNTLPKELRSIVRLTTATLGEVIAEAEGKQFFNEIEGLRRYLKYFRDFKTPKQKLLLAHIQKKFEGKSSDELNKFAHAYSILLELINVCENAHRSHRIESQLHLQEMPEAKYEQYIYWVLTAHPTEARNPLLLAIFENIFLTLQDAFRGNFAMEKEKLKTYLHMAWKTPLARTEKPSPIDEGQTLFSVLLRPNIMETFLKLKEVGYNFSFRTWVGGDKDGHPFVDEKVLLQSLTLSRSMILSFVSQQLGQKTNRKIDVLIRHLKTLSAKDAVYILKLRNEIAGLKNNAQAKMLDHLFEVFPFLLIPLELREEASVLNTVLKEKPKQRLNYPIYRMLITLKKLGPQKSVRHYVRGLIISMVMTAQDVENAFLLAEEIFNGPFLRIVPLFENRQALENSQKIVEEFLKTTSRQSVVKKYWDNKYEVMVGYSDSSKEIGVFKSRLLIRQSVNKLVPLIKAKGLQPIIFHGSGGSITRGGGSFRDQSAWWPDELFTNYKATIQGEMIQRTFASPAVTIQNMAQIIEEQNEHAKSKRPAKLTAQEQLVLERFSNRGSAEYQMLVADPEFLRFVEKATIYSYLNNLTIGSRPSKRKQLNAVTDLRAIPWVLTWTQSRLLLPIWWGLGTSYGQLTSADKRVLKKVFVKDPLCSSFLKQLCFSLAKVEESIFAAYISQAKGLTAVEKKYWINRISKEFHETIKAVHELSGEKDLMWFRPWLGESVKYRSPLIHPLNAIQMLGIRRNNPKLIRETTTGIACGMMTTG